MGLPSVAGYGERHRGGWANRRDGRVTQVIINTLSEDGNVIENEYVRLDAEGKIVGVSHAVYVRVQ